MMRQIGELMRVFQQEATLAVSVMKDKGTARFGRPIVLGAVAVIAAYMLVFKPTATRLAVQTEQIERARATAQYAEEYKTLKSRIREVQGVLPPLKDRGGWLTDTLVDAMKAEALIPESINPPNESKLAGYTEQKVHTTTRAKFAQVVSLLQRLEGHKPFLHVHTLTVTKLPDEPGSNDITIALSTLFPHEGGAP